MSTLVLSREAAVPVAVHEGNFGRNAVLSESLQAPEKPISTAEYPQPEKVLKLLSIVPLGNELKKAVPSRLLHTPGMLISTAEYSHARKRTQIFPPPAFHLMALFYFIWLPRI